MAYLTVENFSAGMDRRRKRVAGAPGTLWLGRNIHITRGGDVERRKKFDRVFHVPGTFGGIAVRGQLYVFGSADLAASMPIGVRYQRLQAPDSAAMAKLHDAKTFSGKIYAIAEFATGHVYHYYDGNRVTDWDILAASQGTMEGIATLLASKLDASDAVTASSVGTVITISALVPGTAFSIAQLATNGGGTNDQALALTQVQANVVAVTEVLAQATVQVTGGITDAGASRISSVTVNDVQLLPGNIDWASSNAATAIRLATAISNGFVTHGYTAAALNDTVTITAAPGTGATPNGYVLDVVTHGNFSVVADGTLSGGVTEVDAVAQIYTATLSGTFEIADAYRIDINATQYLVTGAASGTGRSLYVDKNRVWSPVGSLWNYCKLDDATIWNPSGSDAGFINIASQSEGNEQIVVAARYQNLAAIFSGTEVVLYQLDQDPANFAFNNTLESTGTFAADSVTRYGNNDVFYLDLSGVRSLRARDASNAAFVSDVGNQIDAFLLDYLDELTREQIASAKGAVEPRDGRYWLIVGERIFVLSYFPGAKISAWSYYDTEEFGVDPVQAVAKVRDRVYARAGEYIYAYGGADGTSYPDDDEIIAQVQTQFLSGSTPATIKTLTGFDWAGTNTWGCELAFDPNAEDKTLNVGRLQRITYADENKIVVNGETSMVALNLTCRKAGPATVSMASVHYEGDEAG